jgi:hypothetical protein
VAHPGLVGGVRRPCALQSAAPAGWRPRAAPASLPRPSPTWRFSHFQPGGASAVSIEQISPKFLARDIYTPGGWGGVGPPHAPFRRCARCVHCCSGERTVRWPRRTRHARKVSGPLLRCVSASLSDLAWCSWCPRFLTIHRQPPSAARTTGARGATAPVRVTSSRARHAPMASTRTTPG